MTYKFYTKETSSASFSDITSYITRDSLEITDQIQEKANIAVFAMESNPVSQGQEIKIFDTTFLTTTSTKRLLTVDNLSNQNKKFRVGKPLYIAIGTANEEKVTIESINTVSNQIGITSASNTLSSSSIVGNKRFAGHITRVQSKNLHQLSNTVYKVDCIDYTKEFNRLLINDSFTNKTAGQIIDEFVREKVNPGLTSPFTTLSVQAGNTFTSFSSPFKSPTENMQRLADACGNFAWWIDYDKDIHFVPFEDDVAPFSLDTTSDNFYNLVISSDLNKVKNRQIVLGGLEDGGTVTEFHKGDGAKREWVLRSKFSDLAIAVGTNSSSMTTVSVLPDNINAEASADYFSNYQMQSVRAAQTTSTLETTSLIRFAYTEKIPINVLDEDQVSIAQLAGLGFGNGVMEGRPITDKSINSRAQAQDIARSELLKFSNAVIEASFQTEEYGLKAGQTMRINDPNRNLNQDFLIQSVKEKVYAGQNTLFNVQCASTLFGINELINKLLRIEDKIDLDENTNIDLLKLFKEEINLTSSIETNTGDGNAQIETVSMTSSITTSVQVPPFEYGPGGDPQGKWNLSSWA